MVGAQLHNRTGCEVCGAGHVQRVCGGSRRRSRSKAGDRFENVQNALPAVGQQQKKCVAGSGKWYQASSKTCFNGKAFKITLPLKVAHLPEQVIVSVSYNTTHDGYAPIGETACNSEEQGCFYDSLNVGLTEPSEGGATIGKDPTEAVYVNSTYTEMFCEGGTPGSFAPATCKGFWEGDQPSFEIKASV